MIQTVECWEWENVSLKGGLIPGLDAPGDWGLERVTWNAGAGGVLPTSVDTVHLWSDKIALATPFEAPFKVVRDKCFDKNRPLWVNAAGNTVSGREATCCIDNVVITLSPAGYKRGVRLKLQFSAPKVLWGHNAWPMSGTEFGGAMAIIERLLKRLGIGVRLGEMTIQRLDWNRDLWVVPSFDNYLRVFKWLRPFSNKRKYGYEFPSSLLFGEQKIRFRFYDKAELVRRDLKALGQHEQDTKARWALKTILARLEDEKRHLLRVEVETHPDSRLKKAWGFKTLGDVLAGYDHGAQIFEECLARKVFRRCIARGWDTNIRTRLCTAEPRAMGLERVPHNKRLDYVAALGLNSLLERLPTAMVHEELKWRPQGTPDNRSTIETLQKKSNMGAPYIVLPCGLTFGDLYAELEAALFPNGYW